MSESAHQHDSFCIVCSHVAESGMAVREVIHHATNGWQFLCGETLHQSAETARRACLACALKADPSLMAISDLPPGTWASRDTADGFWHRYLLESEE